MDLNALMSTMLSDESIENLGQKTNASPDEVAAPAQQQPASPAKPQGLLGKLFGLLK